MALLSRLHVLSCLIHALLLTSILSTHAGILREPRQAVPHDSANEIQASSISSPTAGDAGDCWEQWTSWWTASLTASKSTTTVRGLSYGTWTYTTFNRTIYEIPTSYHTTSDYTNELVPGPFGVPNAPTHTETGHTVLSFSGSVWSESRGPSFVKTATFTKTQSISVSTFDLHVTEPACTLPPVVPQCESEWNEFIDAGANSDIMPQPPCTQVALCESQ